MALENIAMIGSDLDGGGDGGSSGAGDGVGEDEDFMYNDDEANNNLSTTAEDFIVINTNARSLCPKINSLVDCFEEVGASLGIITETWLSDGQGLDDDVENFVLGTSRSWSWPTQTTMRCCCLWGPCRDIAERWW